MNFGQYLLILPSLFLAVLLGGMLGFERARSNHDAGLRTHILVCLGSATVMAVSRCTVMEYVGTDIMRMGAQVISGIGFLGVGNIITTGDKVKGLTTAAGLWTTACVGLVVGMGYYFIGVTVVLLMLFVFMGLRPLTARFLYSDSVISITVGEGASFQNLITYLEVTGIENITIKFAKNEKITLEGRLKSMTDVDVVTEELYKFNGIESVHKL